MSSVQLSRVALSGLAQPFGQLFEVPHVDTQLLREPLNNPLNRCPPGTHRPYELCESET
jgi:hypothetical protein